MLRRNLVHMVRYPAVTVSVVAVPVVFLLLFTFVFGGALESGLGSGAYVDYLVPGILIMAVAGGAQGTAISVAMDMTEGIIGRFRTMAIARAAVLNGHVLGSLIQTMLGTLVVVGVALLTGFRPRAGLPGWFAALGVIALIAFAISWLSVAMGMATKSVENASNLPLPLVLLPFLGSGFVPPESMPAGMRWFAENQPFTPMIETLRGLLMGTPIGNGVALTTAWSAVIALVGYLWAIRLYERRSTG
jgi:ABC-2 type transport system permease protein